MLWSDGKSPFHLFFSKSCFQLLLSPQKYHYYSIRPQQLFTTWKLILISRISSVSTKRLLFDTVWNSCNRRWRRWLTMWWFFLDWQFDWKCFFAAMICWLNRSWIQLKTNSLYILVRLAKYWFVENNYDLNTGHKVWSI